MDGRYLNDTPIEDLDRDLFNFKNLVQALQELFLEDANVEESSFTIGILGKWGTGKTSLMKLLRRQLEKNHHDKFVFLEFNAWMFEDEYLRKGRIRDAELDVPGRHVLFIPLLLQLGKVSEGYRYSASKLSLIISKEIVEGVFDLALKTWSEGVFSLPNIRRAVGWLFGKPTYNPSILDYRQRIAELICEITEGFQKKIIIFIDDIDRCDPPQLSLELMEDIKLLMDTPDTFFVLAADYENWIRKLKNVKKFLSETEIMNYFNKFIQLPIYLPQVRIYPRQNRYAGSKGENHEGKRGKK